MTTETTKRKNTYKILSSNSNSYEIGEYNTSLSLAFIYTAYYDIRRGVFTLYPQKGGYRAPGADVRKKEIRAEEVSR